MIRMVAGDFERSLKFEPAYDCYTRPCQHEVKGEHGVHCVTLRFTLRGPAGATTFTLFSGWELRHGMPDGWSLDAGPPFEERRRFRSFTPAGLDFHSPEPVYEGQDSWGACNVIDAEPAYCDGSGLNAELPLWRLLSEGDEGVWDELQNYYRATFDDRVGAEG